MSVEIEIDPEQECFKTPEVLLNLRHIENEKAFYTEDVQAAVNAIFCDMEDEKDNANKAEIAVMDMPIDPSPGELLGRAVALRAFYLTKNPDILSHVSEARVLNPFILGLPPAEVFVAFSQYPHIGRKVRSDVALALWLRADDATRRNILCTVSDNVAKCLLATLPEHSGAWLRSLPPEDRGRIIRLHRELRPAPAVDAVALLLSATAPAASGPSSPVTASGPPPYAPRAPQPQGQTRQEPQPQPRQVLQPPQQPPLQQNQPVQLAREVQQAIPPARRPVFRPLSPPVTASVESQVNPAQPPVDAPVQPPVSTPIPTPVQPFTFNLPSSSTSVRGSPPRRRGFGTASAGFDFSAGRSSKAVLGDAFKRESVGMEGLFVPLERVPRKERTAHSTTTNPPPPVAGPSDSVGPPPIPVSNRPKRVVSAALGRERDRSLPPVEDQAPVDIESAPLPPTPLSPAASTSSRFRRPGRDKPVVEIPSRKPTSKRSTGTRAASPPPRAPSLAPTAEESELAGDMEDEAIDYSGDGQDFPTEIPAEFAACEFLELQPIVDQLCDDDAIRAKSRELGLEKIWGNPMYTNHYIAEWALDARIQAAGGPEQRHANIKKWAKELLAAAPPWYRSRVIGAARSDNKLDYEAKLFMGRPGWQHTMKGMVDLGMPLDKPPLPSPPGYRRKRSGIVPKALPEFATWFPDMSNRFPRRQPGEDEKPESDKHWGERIAQCAYRLGASNTTRGTGTVPASVALAAQNYVTGAREYTKPAWQHWGGSEHGRATCKPFLEDAEKAWGTTNPKGSWAHNRVTVQNRIWKEQFPKQDDDVVAMYTKIAQTPSSPHPSLPDAVPDIMFNIARTCANLTESFIAVVMCHRRTDGMVVPHIREFGPSDPRNGSFFKGTAIGRQAAEEFRVHMSTMFNKELGQMENMQQEVQFGHSASVSPEPVFPPVATPAGPSHPTMYPPPPKLPTNSTWMADAKELNKWLTICWKRLHNGKNWTWITQNHADVLAVPIPVGTFFGNPSSNCTQQGFQSLLKWINDSYDPNSTLTAEERFRWKGQTILENGLPALEEPAPVVTKGKQKAKAAKASEPKAAETPVDDSRKRKRPSTKSKSTVADESTDSEAGGARVDPVQTRNGGSHPPSKPPSNPPAVADSDEEPAFVPESERLEQRIAEASGRAYVAKPVAPIPPPISGPHKLRPKVREEDRPLQVMIVSHPAWAVHDVDANAFETKVLDWIKQTRERQAFLDTSRTPSVIELPHLLELVAINAQLRIAQGEWTIEELDSPGEDIFDTKFSQGRLAHDLMRPGAAMADAMQLWKAEGRDPHAFAVLVRYAYSYVIATSNTIRFHGCRVLPYFTLRLARFACWLRSANSLMLEHNPTLPLTEEAQCAVNEAIGVQAVTCLSTYLQIVVGLILECRVRERGKHSHTWELLLEFVQLVCISLDDALLLGRTDLFATREFHDLCGQDLQANLRSLNITRPWFSLDLRAQRPTLLHLSTKTNLIEDASLLITLDKVTQERWSFYTAYDRFECCILTVIGVEQLATGETWQRRLNSDYGEYKDLGTLTNACLKGLITRIKDAPELGPREDAYDPVLCKRHPLEHHAAFQARAGSRMDVDQPEARLNEDVDMRPPPSPPHQQRPPVPVVKAPATPPVQQGPLPPPLQQSSPRSAPPTSPDVPLAKSSPPPAADSDVVILSTPPAGPALRANDEVSNATSDDDSDNDKGAGEVTPKPKGRSKEPTPNLSADEYSSDPYGEDERPDNDDDDDDEDEDDDAGNVSADEHPPKRRKVAPAPDNEATPRRTSSRTKKVLPANAPQVSNKKGQERKPATRGGKSGPARRGGKSGTKN